MFITKQNIDGCTVLRKIDEQHLMQLVLAMNTTVRKFLKDQSAKSVNNLPFGFVYLTLKKLFTHDDII